MIGFWATLSLNIPDFTRYGRGQREQMLGQTLGLPTTMIIFSAMGVVVTSASAAILVDVSRTLGSRLHPGQITSATPPPGMDAPFIADGGTRAAVAVLALFGVAVATVSVNIAANVVSPANDFANLAPRHISFKTGGLITGILGIVMHPWKLLATAGEYIFNWLIGYSALLGPIAGIMIADYWLIRRCTLDVDDLYRPLGRYRGTNPWAVAALVLGVLPNLPGFLASVHVLDGVGAFWTDLYVYAWFTGTLLAGAIYTAAMGLTGRNRSAA
jgi:NCS1 family nucleobase:cation symporter-1